MLGHHAQKGLKEETSYSFWDQHKVTNTYKLVHPSELAVGAYGYILTNFAAKILLSQLEKIECPIDYVTGSDEKLNLYAFMPPIVRLNNDLSNNYHNMHDRQELREKLRKKKEKEKKPIVQSKKRKLLNFLHLGKIWDIINIKRLNLMQYAKIRRKYK